MSIQTLFVRPLQVVFLLTLGLTGATPAGAEQATELAVSWTADDPGLEWGPCPPFLPEGCVIAVLHGDPAQDNVDIFFKLPPGSKFPLHWHTSAERMVLVAGELHVTYEGQETAILKTGTYAYGPARKKHQGACVSEQPCILFIAFESPLDAIPVEATDQ